jgi:hypothetical protein
MLIETRVRRAIAEVQGIENDFPASWGPTEKGHFEKALLHLERIRETVEPVKPPRVVVFKRLDGDPVF